VSYRASPTNELGLFPVRKCTVFLARRKVAVPLPSGCFPQLFSLSVLGWTLHPQWKRQSSESVVFYPSLRTRACFLITRAVLSLLTGCAAGFTGLLGLSMPVDLPGAPWFMGSEKEPGTSRRFSRNSLIAGTPATHRDTGVQQIILQGRHARAKANREHAPRERRPTCMERQVATQQLAWPKVATQQGAWPNASIAYVVLSSSCLSLCLLR
jgi:hypothetical protein